MRTNYVLVDYENVQEIDLSCFDHENLRFLIFVGSNQVKLPTSLAIQMQNRNPPGRFILIGGNGKNALDFHIAFTIGELCGEVPTPVFHIISKDTGFAPLIDYLKQKKILAIRHEGLSSLPEAKTGSLPTPENYADKFVARLMAPKATKPRSTKTLGNTIRAANGGELDPKEIDRIVKILLERGFVKVDNGKVTYPTLESVSTAVHPATKKK